jgi:hypothetical protein
MYGRANNRSSSGSSRTYDLTQAASKLRHSQNCPPNNTLWATELDSRLAECLSIKDLKDFGLIMASVDRQ